MTDCTNDDAFIDGWYFGRGLTETISRKYVDRTWAVLARLEYERGVCEGRAFQVDFDAAAAGCGQEA
jgi:hypothetical protein